MPVETWKACKSIDQLLPALEKWVNGEQLPQLPKSCLLPHGYCFVNSTPPILPVSFLEDDDFKIVMMMLKQADILLFIPLVPLCFKRLMSLASVEDL